MFLPLMSIAILVGLILERNPARFPFQKGEEPMSGKDEASSLAGDRQPDERSAWIGENRKGGDGTLPQYRPPTHFLAKDAAQIVSFLIRNRGRIDNEATRMKWELLDRFSLPVAVHLRDIEAAAAWDELEKDIAATPPLASLPVKDAPRSPRHRKILALLPEWTERGETVMATAEESAPVPEPGTKDDPEPELPTP